MHPHDAFAAVEDDGEEGEGEDDHAHAGDAGDGDAGEGEGGIGEAQPFEHEGDDDGADDRAGDGAEAAGDDDHQDVVGEEEGEHLRVDGGDEVALQSAADAGEESAEAKGEGAVAEGVYAHDLGRDFVVADGFDDVAEVALEEADDAVDGDDEPGVVDEQGGMGRDALDAEGAVGVGGGVDDEDADDFGEAEGGYAQIVAAEAEDGDADDEGGAPNGKCCEGYIVPSRVTSSQM